MKLIIVTFILCACTLAAGPRRTPERLNALRSRPKPAAKGNRTFHSFGFLHRLTEAESELAFRLSSWGIRQEAEAGPSHALPLPIPSAETSTLMLQGPPGASQ
jgi:hypothetical protein